MKATDNTTAENDAENNFPHGIVASGILKSFGLADDYPETIYPFFSKDPNDIPEETTEKPTE